MFITICVIMLLPSFMTFDTLVFPQQRRYSSTPCPATAVFLVIKSECFFSRHLPKLQACLESSDVNYRIAVGETIALLVELGRDMDEVRGVFSRAALDRRLVWF